MQDSSRLFARSRRFEAEWVWSDGGETTDANTYRLFRKRFVLDAAPAGGAWAMLVSADARYRLWVNGERVGQGPPASMPHHQYFDTYDPTPHLREGENVIAAAVHFLGLQPESRGGFLCEVVDADGGLVVGTDATWACDPAGCWGTGSVSHWMNRVNRYQEFFDAAKWPAGWLDKSWRDDGVPRAVVREPDRKGTGFVYPWVQLLPRDIEQMTETPVRAARVERVEECQGLIQRFRQDDLTVGLSAVGRAVEAATAEGVERLLGDADAGATVLNGSTAHVEDHTVDGVHDPCVVLDFGEVINGYVELELDAPAGVAVELGYAERLIDGRFHNATEGWFAEQYVTRDGWQAWRNFHFKCFRYLKLRVRYAHDPERPVRVHDLRVQRLNYPYESAGGFTSSDGLLNDVHAMCERTVWLCSVESLVDTPWRETAQWLGDVAAVTVPCVYALFGDTAGPGKFYRQSAACVQPTGLIGNTTSAYDADWRHTIPDYSVWWVRGLWEHYRYTGDARWIDEHYPAAVSVMRAWARYVGGDGLVDGLPFWPFVDWAPVDRGGKSAALNAIYAAGLDALHAMAEQQGHTPVQRWSNAQRDAVRRAFVPTFFDEQRGVVIDAVHGDEHNAQVSEHANAAALLFGLLDDKRAARVVEVLFESRPRRAVEAQPFFCAFVLDALAKAGRMDLAIEMIRERWGGRMVKRGLTTCAEEWGINGSWRDGVYRGFMRTLSHAWSAYPAAFLIRGLTGFEIVEPGCARVRVSPASLGFDYAVTVPTPRGGVTVRHEGGATAVDAPAGVTVERGRP